MFWIAQFSRLENHEFVSGEDAMNRTPQLAELLHSISQKASARAWALALALLVVQLITGGKAWGQATTSIRGTVTDSSGGYVAGASVTLTNPESKSVRTAATGNDGGYQFLLLPPGIYTLDVSAPGFQKYEQTGLQLLVNTPATVNVQLKVGATKDVVTLTRHRCARFLWRAAMFPIC
jgi:hypothetical protein